MITLRNALNLIFFTAVLCLPAAAATLRPEAVERFFVAPDQEAVLSWRAGGEPPAGPLNYRVADYWGREVAKGQATRAADGRVEVRLKLPQGYYDIDLPAAGGRFGIVALPAAEGGADPFFAIDTAMSWLVRDAATRPGLIKILRRSGIGMARERLTWGSIQPAAGRWDWETANRFETLRRTYAAEGVEVLEMFHDAPGWMGRVGGKYPDDLLTAARSWKTIAPRWRSTWGALEVWNEPDIFFGGNLPADQYVSLAKTLAYATSQVPLNRPLVGGAFAHANARYLDNAARNGMLQCVDAVSFHTYDRAPQMEELVGRYRRWLRDHGRESMPLWITECGRPWRRGPDRPPTEQDAISALDVTMKAVEARACGVARHFPFVYPFYQENDNNFGMMGREATPLRAMAAYARLATCLAGLPYLGDLACEDKSVRRARVFGDQRRAVVVVYTGTANGSGAVRLDVPFSALQGIDGRKLESTADDAIPTPDGLVYVFLDRRMLGGRLRTDTPAMRLTAAAGDRPQARSSPSPIVLRLQLDPKQLAATSRGYRVLADPAEEVDLTVRVFNFSEQRQTLQLTAAMRHGEVELPVTTDTPVTVGAEASSDVTFRCDLRKVMGVTDQVRVVVEATGPAAGPVLPLVADLSGQPSVSQVLGHYPRRVRLPIHQTGRWKSAMSEGGRMTMSAPGEGHWLLKVHFGPGDRWVYPRFDLPEGIDLARYEGLLLRARCRHKAAVRVFLWEGNNVGYLSGESIIPADGQWHTALVRFADLTLCTATAPDPDNRIDRSAVRRISIGINSEADDNELEVSEAHLIGKG